MSNDVIDEPVAKVLPTQDELPYDDGAEMETERHRRQMELLINSIDPWLAQRGDGYASGNMFVYFSEQQIRNNDFRGPDFFAVLGVPQRYRKSWVRWEESKNPDVVIELLSESTATFDKTEKKDIYQNRMKVPEYFWYDPHDSDDFAGFTLRNGVYEPLPVDEQGRLYSAQLGLYLVRWYGHGDSYGAKSTWLRWEDQQGNLLLTKDEAAMQQADEASQRANEAAQQANEASQQAEIEKQRADAAAQLAALEKKQNDKLMAKLRELGVDPDDIK